MSEHEKVNHAVIYRELLEIKKIVEPLASDVTDIKEIVGAWRAAGTLGKFVKWGGGILAAVLSVWIAVKALWEG